MFSKELKEECGVFGVWGVPHAAEVTYYGLHSLQHRGQEGCGIVSVNDNGELHRVKGLGLVTEVFNSENLGSLHGNMAVGHVRYSTHGGGGIENVQPFLFRHNSGDFALVHNGNVVNSAQLRKYLEDRGSLFQSTSDSEILAHLIKKEPVERNSPRIIPIMEALNMIEGAFAFMVMTNHRIYAMRDKYGLRPLSIGRIGDGYVLSSETCAFSVVGAEFVRDVEPGEVVTIDHHGIRSRKYSDYQRHAMCAMEYIYFSRPDSDIEGRNVHSFRKESGKILYRVLHDAPDRRQFHLHTFVPHLLRRLDESPADIAVLDETDTVRNAGELCVADGCRDTGIRYADNHVSAVEEAVMNTMHRIEGAYSLVVMSPRKLIAAPFLLTAMPAAS